MSKRSVFLHKTIDFVLCMVYNALVSLRKTKQKQNNKTKPKKIIKTNKTNSQSNQSKTNLKQNKKNLKEKSIMKKTLSIIAALSIIISAFSMFSITASAATDNDAYASVGASNTIVHIIDASNQTTDISVPVGSDFVLPEGKDYDVPGYFVNRFVDWSIAGKPWTSYAPGQVVKIDGEITFKAYTDKAYYVRTRGTINGSVTVDKDIATEFETVKVNVKADKGYKVSSVTVMYDPNCTFGTYGEEVLTPDANGDCEFNMQKGGAKIIATFVPCE